MIGSIISLELLLARRRGKSHVYRGLYAAWLMLQTLLVGLARAGSDALPFDSAFLSLLIVQHYVLMVFLAPALSAGAITDEKTRGTLQYLLSADLDPAAIVLGKLIGRFAQLAELALTALPVFCFCGVIAGLSPIAIFGLVWLTLLLLFAIGSASLLVSVLCRHTRDAVLTSYALLAAVVFVGFSAPRLIRLGTFAVHFDRFMQSINPFAILTASLEDDAGATALRLGWATLVYGAIGLASLGMATWRLRPTYMRQLEHVPAASPAAPSGTRRPVGADPIRWKERQLDGLAPLATLRRYPTWLGMLAVFCTTVLSSTAILWAHLPRAVTASRLWDRLAAGDLPGLVALLNLIGDAQDAFQLQAIAVMLLASLTVAVRCSSAVSGEREQHTWEALLVTPLDTELIVRGKLWGVIGATYPYLRAYAIPAVILSLLGGWLALFWTLIWLAVTWLAQYYAGAAGLWCSVRAVNSWRSLLGTLFFCYAGAFLACMPLSILALLLAVLLIVILKVLDFIWGLSAAQAFAAFLDDFWTIYLLALCLALAWFFWLTARRLLASAEKRVAQRERIRHWDKVGRTRRRPARVKT